MPGLLRRHCRPIPEAGLPEGDYANVYASNDQIAVIIADPRIHGVSLAGSERAGELIYNTERPHQGLPGRLTPRQSWDATAVADAPRPKPIPVLQDVDAPAPVAPSLAEHVLDGGGAEAQTRSIPTGLDTETDLETSAFENITGSISHPAATGSQELRVYSNGVVNIGRTLFSLTKRMSGRIIVAAWDQEGVMFANTEGEVIAEYAWPPEGTGYVGISRSLTRFRSARLSEGTVTDVLRHQLSPVS